MTSIISGIITRFGYGIAAAGAAVVVAGIGAASAGIVIVGGIAFLGGVALVVGGLAVGAAALGLFFQATGGFFGF